MSAIRMTCNRCDGQYIAGMVGQTPWPRHVCPDGVTVYRSLEEIKFAPRSYTDAQAEAIRHQVANRRPLEGQVPELEDE